MGLVDEALLILHLRTKYLILKIELNKKHQGFSWQSSKAYP